MQLQLDPEQKEIKTHGSFEFPLRISYEQLSWFDTENFPLHWHPEVELTLILEGAMCYQINDQVYPVRAGEGLFCNSNAMHAGWKASSGQDCRYLSITFHPRILYGYRSSILQSKYVEPILQSKQCSSLHFKPNIEWMQAVLLELKELLRLFEQKPEAMEIRMQVCLLRIWTEMYEHLSLSGEEQERHTRDTERIRTLVQYLQQHYQEPLTLDELADQVHLCRSECCRLFKRYMKETLFEYLLRYRIERSLELLRGSTLNVTQIAEQSGFATPGYYTRTFREKIGCTPLQYRKLHESST